MHGRTFVTALVALLGLMGACDAQQYPTKPVTLIVGASAGGGTDVQARILTERLSARLGKRVVVDNRPGAGSNIATTAVAKAPPDGHTLALVATSTPINHSLYARPGFDALVDLTPVAGWAEAPLLFVVNPKLPVSTLQELAEYSKRHPDELDYGNAIGFTNQMVMELFKLEAGANIQFIPYQGLVQARTDVIAGEIETTVDSIASSGPYIESGQLKALAITSPKRVPRFPDVPTVAEAGYPNVTRNTWYGVVAPARTPPAIVQKLAAEIAAIQAEPEVIKRIEATGAVPFVAGPEEFREFMKAEVELWASVIAESKMEKVR
jgi:tripartite-type tricarboxylate transporter receptor subunit TctC